jgi:hypothetical protein
MLNLKDVRRHQHERERIRQLARDGTTFKLGPCKRDGCGHDPDDHRLDDSSNISPVSMEAEFRCVGHAENGKWIDTECSCPDYVQNIIKLPPE